MAAIPKHKPKAWRENQGEKILKMRKELKEDKKRLKEDFFKETGIITPDDDFKSNMPVLGGSKDPTLSPDGFPKGELYLHKGEWKPLLEAKHRKLIKGFPKLTKRGWK